MEWREEEKNPMIFPVRFIIRSSYLVADLAVQTAPDCHAASQDTVDNSTVKRRLHAWQQTSNCIHNRTLIHLGKNHQLEAGHNLCFHFVKGCSDTTND